MRSAITHLAALLTAFATPLAAPLAAQETGALPISAAATGASFTQSVPAEPQHTHSAAATPTPAVFLFTEEPRDLPAWRPGNAAASPAAMVKAPAQRAVLTHSHQASERRADERILTQRLNYNRGIADYGPFRVVNARRAALLGETGSNAPYWFAKMLRENPELTQIDLVECPGTRDDLANLRLGRMIREAGMNTFVPAIGSVRSGAVELFLAGASRKIADGAEFAVHSWRDAEGREAHDFAFDAPQNAKYFDYYSAIGMSESEARAFYAMTNSVPHHKALWLDARDMRQWSNFGREAAAPRLTYASASFPG